MVWSVVSSLQRALDLHYELAKPPLDPDVKTVRPPLPPIDEVEGCQSVVF